MMASPQAGTHSFWAECHQNTPFLGMWKWENLKYLLHLKLFQLLRDGPGFTCIVYNTTPLGQPLSISIDPPRIAACLVCVFAKQPLSFSLPPLRHSKRFFRVHQGILSFHIGGLLLSPERPSVVVTSLSPPFACTQKNAPPHTGRRALWDLGEGCSSSAACSCWEHSVPSLGTPWEPKAQSSFVVQDESPYRSYSNTL